MDIVTLSEKLGEKLKEVVGVSYLGELINCSLNAVNIKNYGSIVKEKSNYRHLKGILTNY
ncbi:DnaB-like helicase N terminal domain-containing protein [Clostridium magnum DSM 2767]|nr:DnaB-like helicase N terminal domain-containing protein [Clostridium magnum DSM 2767]